MQDSQVAAMTMIQSNVAALVQYPDRVQLTAENDDRGILLSLTVHPDDLGRVIGKKGCVASALRTLLRSLGMTHNARFGLKILDTNEASHNHGEDE